MLICLKMMQKDRKAAGELSGSLLCFNFFIGLAAVNNQILLPNSFGKDPVWCFLHELCIIIDTADSFETC